VHAFHKPDPVADITDLHMLAVEGYVEIVAQDVLEHLPRTATLGVLQEWARLPAPGGRMWLRVPA
jgi:hypothetical protein